MPDGDNAIDLTKLPRPQRWVLDLGPWLSAAVGIFIVLYPVVGTPSGAIAGTCLIVGPGVVLIGTMLPRVKSFKLSATEASASLSNVFVGPATAPTRAPAGGMAGPHAIRHEDPPLRPTIGAVVDAAVRQHWTTSTRGSVMTLTNPDHQSFSFSRNDAADPISDGFLQALQAYGLTWPSNS